MYNDFMNKEYPVVFIDLDNTFYDHENHVVPKKHIDAIRQLKQKGFKVCTCTGRPMNLVEELNILDLIEWDGHVTGNGSFVYDKDCHYYTSVTTDDEGNFQLELDGGFYYIQQFNTLDNHHYT